MARKPRADEAISLCVGDCFAPLQFQLELRFFCLSAACHVCYNGSQRIIVSSQAVFSEVEHTADWAIRVRGATLPELFANAATGMYSLVADRSFMPTVERQIEVRGIDAEALLVNWLNELVYHTEMYGDVFCEFHLESFEPTWLRATAKAGRGVELKKQIKAVTFHNLQIVSTGEGYEVTIVFDV